MLKMVLVYSAYFLENNKKKVLFCYIITCYE